VGATSRARRTLMRTASVAALACVTVTAAACGGGDSDSGGSTGTTASGRTTETLTLASNAWCSVTTDVTVGYPGGRENNLAYATLIYVEPDGRTLQPGLAESWEVEPGNGAITFTMRPDAKFSDGTPVDAQAVKTWLDFRNTVVSPYDPALGRIKRVDVLDERTVKVTVKEPNPVIADAFSQVTGSNWGMVVNPKAIAKIKADPRSDYLKRNSAGAGAYVMVPSETTFGDTCTYVPNKHYYDQSRIKWAKVVSKNIPDANTLLAAARTGQIDIVEGDSSTADAARAAGLKVVFTPGRLQGVYFYDKTGRLNPALADVRVRQALNYAIDRRTITESLFGRDAIPTSNPNPTTDGDDPATFNYYDYDPEKARQLLAEAGYPDGFTMTLSAAGAFQGPYKTTPLAQAVAADLAKVGVRVDITSAATPGEDSANVASRRFDARSTIFGSNATWIWYGRAMVPGGFIADQHGFRDPELDKLWAQAARSTPEEAAPIWREIMNQTIEKAYFLAVMSPGWYAYVGDRVDGAEMLSDGAYGPLDGWTPSGK
jgi:peptide/nickel transport system substrate-binding protein